MPRASESESPFKRDEPVSRSRKWILIIFYFWLGLAALILLSWIVVPTMLGMMLTQAIWYMPMGYLIYDQDYREIFGFLVMMVFLFLIIILAILLTVQMWRVARAAKHCREKRSFDLMAAAVRSQQLFWGILAVGTTCSAIYMVFQASQMKPVIKTLDELVRKELVRREQQNPQQP